MPEVSAIGPPCCPGSAANPAYRHFKKFEPREVIAERDKVVVLGFYDAKSLTTGRGMSSEWVMVFTLREGTIVHFREFADVAAINAVFA